MSSSAAQQVAPLNISGIFVAAVMCNCVEEKNVIERREDGSRVTGPGLFVCLSKSHTSEIISVY